MVGGTLSEDFPRTTGPAFNNGACSSLGTGERSDAFITKFSPTGQLVWSRLLGGPCYDRAYAVEADDNGYVYVAGRAGKNFPTTQGAFQTNFNGVPNTSGSAYGAQNGFVAKLSPDGAIVWASYVGGSSLVRDLDIDHQGNIYLNAGQTNRGGTPPSSWYANGFQSTRPGGMDNGAMKVSNDGSSVIWATWIGSPGEESTEASIRVDNQGYVYLAGCTKSTGFPTDPKNSTNPDVFDRTYNGAYDGFVVKLTPDGSDLVYGTYIGGSADDVLCNTHNLAVDNSGNAYISTHTASSDFPTTAGAFDRTYNGGSPGDMAVVKFSSTGALLASTFIGGSAGENPDGIYVSQEGNVFIAAGSDSNDFPIANPLNIPAINYDGSYNHGQSDAIILLLSADFSQLLFSTYLGGPSDEGGRSGFLGNDGSMYVVGSSKGSGWPVISAYQSVFAGGALDNILAKLAIQIQAP
jgi:hypothetical protein